MCRKSLFLLLVPTLFWSQQKSNFEIGLELENDSFVSTYNDFYYTNGLFAYANYVSAKSTAAKKIIHGFQLGQKIYNPRNVKSVFPEDHNRPFVGYLFAEYNRTKMYQSNQVFKMSFGLGRIGPDSKAEEFQDWMHETFGFGGIYGWEYQIKNLWAFQLGAEYSFPIFSKITSNKIDFHCYSQGEAGTAFTGLSVGTLARISLSKSLKPMQNSNFYNGLNNAKKEFYFYILPKINLQLYDATIQGSMFNDKSEVTFDLKPLRFKGEAGLKFKYNQYNLGCVFNYTTNEINNGTATGYTFGSLEFSYLF
eukprot:Opistho-1_new@11000